MTPRRREGGESVWASAPIVREGSMSKVYFNLNASDFFQDWSDTSQLTTANNWDGVASIVGYRGDDIITATAVDPRTATADLSGPINVAVNAGAALLESG